MPPTRLSGPLSDLLLVGDAGGRVVDVVEDAMAELQQRLAGGGDLDAAAEPDEQPLVELVLEQQDLPADRRLRDVQLGAGAGEGAGFGDGPDDFQLARSITPDAIV